MDTTPTPSSDLFDSTTSIDSNINPYNGDESSIFHLLDKLDDVEIVKYVRRRAEYWRIVNFVMANREDDFIHDLGTYEECISLASFVLQSEIEKEVNSKTYKAKRAYFNAVRKGLRNLMLRRGDAKKCVYCNATKDITIDHVIPLIKGGSNDLENLQFLCRKCNSKKHTKMPAMSHTPSALPLP